MINIFSLGNKEKALLIVTYIIVGASILYAILPMLVYRGDYVFTIHDGLDGYGGVVQYIHDNGLSLIMNLGVDFNNADLSSYFYILSCDAYTILCCVFGLVTGQIINRIIGVLIGFFSMRLFLNKVFPPADMMHRCCILIASAAYAVTPIAPNRIIAFATLPLAVLLYLELKDNEKFSKLTLLAFFIPFFSLFAGAVVFIIGFWTFFMMVHFVMKKSVNKNLVIGFILMVFSAIIVNRSYFIMAFGDNNRRLLSRLYHNDFWTPFKNYLLDGQYHSSGLQGLLMLAVLLLMTAWMLCYRLENANDITSEYKKSAILIIAGWVLWFGSALLLAAREAGLETGIIFIDGFAWGRLIGFMRPAWYIMIISFVAIKPKEKIFKNNVTGGIAGVVLGIFVWYGLRLFLGSGYTTTLVKFQYVELCAKLGFLLFSILIFTSYNLREYLIYVLLCIQMVYVMISSTIYNDTGITLIAKITDDRSDGSITLNEFYSTELFDEIKKDIAYDGELVAAYGYHPAVLQYNGFHTIDRYESVHSMKMQDEFREIIAPALEKYPNYKEYYDGWGGRMYLYGELGYGNTRVKDLGEYPLYINTDAFKKYGGRYILSKAVISNAKEINLKLVNDYSMEDSIYHIFLYEVK
ncbi:MAG: hypothetical protein E7254_12405 [Lachnospiraceae bacterium]|nr:hypothetical protein [Lachnospiraceae bacterium]